jgi:hypothetical protein
MRKKEEPMDLFTIFCLWILLICSLMWAAELMAAEQVYLESERDLGNGKKLCIYSEGVVITIPSHQLCPMSIRV